MQGIWFNLEDLKFSKKTHTDYECLKLLGFTDAYVLIKGCGYDLRSRPKHHAELDRLFAALRLQGIRTHCVFYCSDDWHYVEMHPDRTDITILGNRSKRRISHLDPYYVDHLVDSVTTAVREYEPDGIQFDFVRFGVIGNGWSPKEEAVYRSFGVDVPKLKEELLSKYDESKPECNVGPILYRYVKHDEQLIALASGRRSVICGFLRTVTDRVRAAFPDKELSVAMMPEAFYPPWLPTSVLQYGQAAEDFYPLVDHVVPMAYSGVYGMNSRWITTIGQTAAAEYPGAIIGIDSIQPRTTESVRADITALRGLQNADICFFRYGRMIFEVRDGQDTLLYNTYPGTVTRLILRCEADEHTRDCELEEASWLRIPGHWDEIRAFGSFDADDPPRYDGELCVLNGGNLH